MTDYLSPKLRRRAIAWAGQLTSKARQFAPAHIAPFIHSSVEERDNGFMIRIGVENKAPTGEGHYNYGSSDARAQELGSGIEATRGNKTEYPIKVKWRPPFLVFMGTNDFAGQLIRIEEVSHPGIKPFHEEGYLHPAVREQRARMRQELTADVNDALKLTLQEAFKDFNNGK